MIMGRAALGPGPVSVYCYTIRRAFMHWKNLPLPRTETVIRTRDAGREIIGQTGLVAMGHDRLQVARAHQS